MYEAVSPTGQSQEEAWLLALAKIVHGADVNADVTETPESAGLEALGTGFGPLCRDDHEALDLEFPMYDALYACLKKRLA